MKKDSKPKHRVSSKNLQKLAQTFADDAKYMATASYTSESLTPSERSMKHVTKTSLDLVHQNSSKLEITRPKNPIETISPTLFNNEVMVFDVNGSGVLHSLMTRGGAWFLDVSDFDAMDKTCNFQYLAMRPSPQANLILTRVPELRHLLYVSFDDEGRPHPIQMREVAKANYLTLDKEDEETPMGHTKTPSLWESLSLTLRRTVMFNEGPHTEERIEGLQNNP